MLRGRRLPRGHHVSAGWTRKPVNKTTQFVAVGVTASVAMVTACEVIVLTLWLQSGGSALTTVNLEILINRHGPKERSARVYLDSHKYTHTRTHGQTHTRTGGESQQISHIINITKRNISYTSSILNQPDLRVSLTFPSNTNTHVHAHTHTHTHTHTTVLLLTHTWSQHSTFCTLSPPPTSTQRIPGGLVRAIITPDFRE